MRGYAGKCCVVFILIFTFLFHGVTFADVSQLKSINDKVKKLSAEGRYEEALEYAKKSLELTEKKFGKDNINMAEALRNLALIHYSLGNYEKAEPLLKRALIIYQDKKGEKDPTTLSVSYDLGMVLYYLAKYDEAEKLHRKVLALRRKFEGEKAQTTGQSYNALGLVLFARDNYSEAESVFRKSLAIRKGTPGEAMTLNNLAEVLRVQGLYEDAESAYLKALKIFEKKWGKKAFETSVPLNNLAAFYFFMGRYAKAEEYYKRALEILNGPGIEGNEKATILHNLGELYKAMGRLDEAESLIKKALEIDKKTIGEEHPEYATGLNNLAEIYRMEGEYRRPEILHKKALEIREKALGSNHPALVQSLNNLAEISRQQGRYKEAEGYFKRSLSIDEKVYGREHPLIAQSLNNVAALYMTEGKYKKAAPLLKEALNIIEKHLGSDHPDVAAILNNLALVEAADGMYDKSLKLMERVEDVDRNVINDVFDISSEKQKFQFLSMIRGRYEMFLSLILKGAGKDPSFARAGMDRVLREKGIILEALSLERESLLSSSSPEIRELYKKLNEKSALLSSLVLGGPGTLSPDAYRNKIRKLREEREEIEREMAQKSGKSAKIGSGKKVNCEALQKTLPQHSILIEYVTFSTFNFNAVKGEKLWNEQIYAAFVLPSAGRKNSVNAEPFLVELGKASVIDEAVLQYRKEIKRTSIHWQSGVLNEKEAEENLAQKGKKLYDLILKPILKKTGKVDRIYVSPDGGLNLVPFDALKDDDNKYLCEKYEIFYLTTGRDLISSKAAAENSGKTIVVANPDFDMKAIDKALVLSHNDNVHVNRTMRSEPASLRGVKWKALPGTGLEADEIVKLLKGQRYRDLRGRDALEERIKTLQSPRRLHLATHGFFIEPDAAGGKSDREIFENPLLRSGVVLAGVNNRESGKETVEFEDGILTALEISGLSLEGTDLVVLSACNTGLGENRPGEGVMGLRRAFELAGAKTVVMSLWSVPDRQTAELMVMFYKELKKGDSASKSLRRARLAVIEKRRKDKGAAHPFFWAAFISVGKP